MQQEISRGAQTPYEIFVNMFNTDPEQFREIRKTNGDYDFNIVVKGLVKLQNSMNGWQLEDWFGKELGGHLWQKFLDSNRNLLNWFTSLTDEYKFFIVVQANIMKGGR